MFLQDSNHRSRNWLALPPQWYRRTDWVVCASGVLLHPCCCCSCKGSAWLKVYPLLASLGGVCDGKAPFSDKLGSEFRCRCGENHMWVLDGDCFKMISSRCKAGQLLASESTWLLLADKAGQSSRGRCKAPPAQGRLSCETGGQNWVQLLSTS